MADHTDALAVGVQAGARHDLPILRKSGRSDGRCGATLQGEEPDFPGRTDGSAAQMVMLSSVVVLVACSRPPLDRHVGQVSGLLTSRT